MDPTKNQSTIVWEINRGDIVRYRDYIGAGAVTEAVYRYGIVIAKVSEEYTESLFPGVEVFMFDNHETKIFTAGSIETVSSIKI